MPRELQTQLSGHANPGDLKDQSTNTTNDQLENSDAMDNWRTGENTTKGPSETQSQRRDVRTSITGMRSGDLAASNISRFHSRPQERRLNTGSRLYRAMLAPAAAPPGRPRVFPQAEKTNPGGSNLLW